MKRKNTSLNKIVDETKLTDLRILKAPTDSTYLIFWFAMCKARYAANKKNRTQALDRELN